MAAAKMSMAITEHGGEEQDQDRRPLVRHYQAQELIPPRRPLLHNLLDKQLSAWASAQVVSGVLSFGLGLVFATTAEFNSFLIILFRIPFLNGALFFIAGLLSNLLHREPRLLPVCFRANLACMVCAIVGTVIMCVDLALMENTTHKKTEVLVLCVTLVQMILSALLTFWIHKEQLRLKPRA
ncbi:uncharacterized protein si:ch211-269k10.4 [Alosa sapidissima]|uniref:uncharacterized protein si:ch211-269k10.4 n=1 Tax=Alosa sapidissima TaxID=34773 RepID=UPI001C0850B2|nr:uncharacterized protein si:ch211-269k10.4 [Alosa sapidissima]XP_041963025.1 uncharacterized protein si:ch211-269k10.4 [Alosa sapidissima]XP_041963026.1 uncharacterized protein si:ch211-269k10.4 [Alosa sapidissima]XP_041963027.1 uncharacterized protein si:ch211-269k10.4 [Alosa sapidissima]